MQEGRFLAVTYKWEFTLFFKYLVTIFPIHLPIYLFLLPKMFLAQILSSWISTFLIFFVIRGNCTVSVWKHTGRFTWTKNSELDRVYPFFLRNLVQQCSDEVIEELIWQDYKKYAQLWLSSVDLGLFLRFLEVIASVLLIRVTLLIKFLWCFPVL